MSDVAKLSNAAGSEVSRETAECLKDFEWQFRHWNKSINLVAPSTLPDFWERHVLDSVQLWRYRADARSWMDIGSGGGFPGIVIAILGRDGDLHVTLVESNHKKASFLRSCGARYGLKIDVRAVRIETVAGLAPSIVSARALADLKTLLAMTETWIDPGKGRALLHKGRDYVSEIEEARVHWNFDLVEHQSVVDPMSRILEISNVERSEHQ
jgi:16S rRNA (guanine527-N7)-methyltransferase